MTNQKKYEDLSKDEQDFIIQEVTQSVIKTIHEKGLCSIHTDEKGVYHLHPEVETYKIITQLNQIRKLLDSGKLDNFLSDIQKKSPKILEVTDNLSKINENVIKNYSKFDTFLNNVILLDERLSSHHRELNSWISQAGGRLEFAAFDGVEKMTRKFKQHMNINTICNIVIIIFLYLIYKNIGAK